MQSKICVGLVPMESEFNEQYSMYNVDNKFDWKLLHNSEN
jgi:hypothetical protein